MLSLLLTYTKSNNKCIQSEWEKEYLSVIQLWFLFLNFYQCFLVSSNGPDLAVWPKGTQGHPLASQFLGHNSKWTLPKREKGRKGRGGDFVVKGKGVVSKIPIWEGKENIGSSSLPQRSRIFKGPIPLSMHAHPPAEEALHSRWGESWNSYCGEADQTFFSFSFFSLRLSFSAFAPLSRGSVLHT